MKIFRIFLFEESIRKQQKTKNLNPERFHYLKHLFKKIKLLQRTEAAKCVREAVEENIGLQDDATELQNKP